MFNNISLCGLESNETLASFVRILGPIYMIRFLVKIPLMS